MTSRRYNFRWPLAAVVLLAAVTFVGGAAAQDPDDAAVDEYAEIVPTGEGGRDPTSGDETTQTLSPSVAAEVESEAGSAAAVLKLVATSPRYGAPQRQLRAVGGSEEAGGIGPRSPVSAAVNAIATDGSGSRFGILLVVMLAIGISAVVVAARRHRAGRA